MADNIKIDGGKLLNGENSEASVPERDEHEKELIKRLNALKLDGEKEIEKFKLSQQKKRTKEQRKEELELQKEIAKIQGDSAKVIGLTLKDSLGDLFNVDELQKTLSEATGAALATTLNNTIKNAVKLANSAISSVDAAAELYASYTSTVNARLQGSDKTFADINKLIRTNIGSSQYVNQKDMLTNLSKLVENGIAYNVEQRAFLQTISDDIATTFDAANGTLLQLIRIQQADTTAARLGSEANLTRYLNQMFQDTSYLSAMYDNVSTLLLEANSQLSSQSSVEFEYVVQKWLGSLSSVGVSDSTLQLIAQGINYLGTGNIGGLNNSQSLQNLLVMAANRAGLDYASLLTGGINANTTNKLLSGLVDYMQSISSSTNQVVKSQYANLFGMTISDMTAVLKLSSNDLVSISDNMLTYSQTLKEVDYQISQIPSRMHLAERIQNLTENAILSIGGGIANNAGSYAAWLITSMIEQATGGINIPYVSVMGSGIDLNATVEGLIKLGMVGASTLGQIGSIVTGLVGVNNLSLANWNASSYTSRGSGFVGVTGGTSSTTSQSAFVGNTDSNAAYDSTLTAAKDKATKSVSGQKEELTFKEGIEKHVDVRLDAIIDILRAVVDGSAPFYTVSPLTTLRD